MKKIQCTDRMISIDNIESMKLIERMDFIGDNLPKGIILHKKGEKYSVRKMFRKRTKTYEENIYEWRVGYYTFSESAKELVEELKNEFTSIFSEHFECPDMAEYNAEQDCLTRKATIKIRTKSGDTLFAVYENTEDAQKVIDEFNSL